MANRSRSHSDKSASSSAGCLTGNTDMEYFWCFELSEDQRSFKWVIKCEDEDDDEDFIEHTIFVKLAVLDGDAVAGEQNIVVFESDGQDGEMQTGTIANLTKEVNPMATLNISINGKIGGTFTLSEGSGPVTISGNHYLGFPQNENLDISQAELDNKESAVEEGEKKSKKSAKLKVASVSTKRKNSNKDDDTEEEEDLEEEDDDSDEEDDDDDDESEEEIKMMPAKKVKDAGKKVHTKPDKDAAKKPMKKQKK